MKGKKKRLPVGSPEDLIQEVSGYKEDRSF
jgi:hypothetical protein